MKTKLSILNVRSTSGSLEFWRLPCKTDLVHDPFGHRQTDGAAGPNWLPPNVGRRHPTASAATERRALTPDGKSCHPAACADTERHALLPEDVRCRGCRFGVLPDVQQVLENAFTGV